MSDKTLKFRTARHESSVWTLWFMAPIVLLFLLGPISAQDPVRTSGVDEVSRIEKTYGIEIVTNSPKFPARATYGIINGKSVDEKELDIYLRLFTPEFSIYPVSVVKRSLLKRIVICKELSFDGQLRNAVPDFEHDTLYLEASRGSYSKVYMRKVIHHEYFHIIDYRDDGKVYEDQDWSSLNPKGFKYGSGGINAQGLDYSSVLTDRFPGFVDYYSTTGVEEDKAEVFANLLVDPVYVENRMKTDVVLRSKVKLMMDLLFRFSGDLNGEFWKKLSSMERAAE